MRFNPFHDQLLLTASSDARVLLSSAASVSSEYGNEVISIDESENIESKQMYIILAIQLYFATFHNFQIIRWSITMVRT